jgi:hypothetical protein
MLIPRLTGGPTRWARNLSSARRTRTMVSTTDRGDTDVSQRGQALRHLEVARMTCH